jgi:PAS domain S-box-containing protein
MRCGGVDIDGTVAFHLGGDCREYARPARFHATHYGFRPGPVLAETDAVPAKSSTIPHALDQLLPGLVATSRLFDHVPDTAFFVKDRMGRYVAVNPSLAERCGVRSSEALLGRHVNEIFPRELAERYAAQDEAVMKSGQPIIDRLELHWYPHRRAGWCLTTKLPLRDAAGRVCGLIGLSRDLRGAGGIDQIPAGLGAALEWLEKNYGERLNPAALAKRAGLTPTRLARLTKRIFRLTPSQLIAQCRLAAAARLLTDSEQSVAEIALQCGFYDHSAFTRAFRAATGLAPREYRGKLRVES